MINQVVCFFFDVMLIPDEIYSKNATVDTAISKSSLYGVAY
jgi:hypothetical protein